MHCCSNVKDERWTAATYKAFQAVSWYFISKFSAILSFKLWGATDGQSVLFDDAEHLMRRLSSKLQIYRVWFEDVYDCQKGYTEFLYSAKIIAEVPERAFI